MREGRGIGGGARVSRFESLFYLYFYFTRITLLVKKSHEKYRAFNSKTGLGAFFLTCVI
jgi:hypothetical protein